MYPGYFGHALEKPDKSLCMYREREQWTLIKVCRGEIFDLKSAVLCVGNYSQGQSLQTPQTWKQKWHCTTEKADWSHCHEYRGHMCDIWSYQCAVNISLISQGAFYAVPSCTETKKSPWGDSTRNNWTSTKYTNKRAGGIFHINLWRYLGFRYHFRLLWILLLVRGNLSCHKRLLKNS